MDGNINKSEEITDDFNCHDTKSDNTKDEMGIAYFKAREERRILSAIDKTNAPSKYSMKGTFKTCKVIDVYDGDTVTIVMMFSKEDIRCYSFRLHGIDTPEMRPPKTHPNRENEIQKAKNAKAYLEGLVMNKIVYIEFVEEEKYGRLMGTIYLDSGRRQNVNEMMVNGGYARRYDGGKKESSL